MSKGTRAEDPSSVSPDPLSIEILKFEAAKLGIDNAKFEEILAMPIAEIFRESKALYEKLQKTVSCTQEELISAPNKHLIPVNNRPQYQYLSLFFRTSLHKYHNLANKSRKDLAEINEFISFIGGHPLFTSLDFPAILKHLVSPKRSDNSYLLIDIGGGTYTNISKLETKALILALTDAIRMFPCSKDFQIRHFHLALVLALAEDNLDDLEDVVKAAKDFAKRYRTFKVEDLLRGFSSEYQSNMPFTNLVLFCDFAETNQCLPYLISEYQKYKIDVDAKGSSNKAPIHTSLLEVYHYTQNLFANFNFFGTALAHGEKIKIQNIAFRIKQLLAAGCKFDAVEDLVTIPGLDVKDLQENHAALRKLCVNLAICADNLDQLEDVVVKHYSNSKTTRPSFAKLREVAENLRGKEKFYFDQVVNDKFDKYLNSLRLHKPDSYSFLLGKITKNNHIIASADPKDAAGYLMLIKHNVNILLQAAQYGIEGPGSLTLKALQEGLEPISKEEIARLEREIEEFGIDAFAASYAITISQLFENFSQKFPENLTDLDPLKERLFRIVDSELGPNFIISALIIDSTVDGVDSFDIKDEYSHISSKGRAGKFKGIDVARCYAKSNERSLKYLSSNPCKLYDETIFDAICHSGKNCYDAANSKRADGQRHDTEIAFCFNTTFLPHIRPQENIFAYNRLEELRGTSVDDAVQKNARSYVDHGLSENFDSKHYIASTYRAHGKLFGIHFLRYALEKATDLLIGGGSTVTDSSADLAHQIANPELFQARNRILHKTASGVITSDDDKTRFLMDILTKNTPERSTVMLGLLIHSQFISKGDLKKLLITLRTQAKKEVDNEELKARIARVDEIAKEKFGTNLIPSLILLKDESSDEEIKSFLAFSSSKFFVGQFDSFSDLLKERIIANIKESNLSLDITQLLRLAHCENLEGEQKKCLDVISEHEESFQEKLEKNIKKHLADAKTRIADAIFFNDEHNLDNAMHTASELVMSALDDEVESFKAFLKEVFVKNLNKKFPHQRQNLLLTIFCSHVKSCKALSDEFELEFKRKIESQLSRAGNDIGLLYARKILDIDPFDKTSGKSIFETVIEDGNVSKDIEFKNQFLLDCLYSKDLPKLSQEQCEKIAHFSLFSTKNDEKNQILERLFDLGYDFPKPNLSSDKLCIAKLILLGTNDYTIEMLQKRSQHFPIDSSVTLPFLLKFINNKETAFIVADICSGHGTINLKDSNFFTLPTVDVTEQRRSKAKLQAEELIAEEEREKAVKEKMEKAAKEKREKAVVEERRQAAAKKAAAEERKQDAAKKQTAAAKEGSYLDRSEEERFAEAREELKKLSTKLEKKYSFDTDHGLEKEVEPLAKRAEKKRATSEKAEEKKLRQKEELATKHSNKKTLAKSFNIWRGLAAEKKAVAEAEREKKAVAEAEILEKLNTYSQLNSVNLMECLLATNDPEQKNLMKRVMIDRMQNYEHAIDHLRSQNAHLAMQNQALFNGITYFQQQFNTQHYTQPPVPFDNPPPSQFNTPTVDPPTKPPSNSLPRGNTYKKLSINAVEFQPGRDSHR